jgi:hypothetical protein
VALELLFVSSLANLVWLDAPSVRLVVDALHAVLDDFNDEHEPVQQFYISSQCQFVDKKQRLGDSCIHERMLHGRIASMCMGPMSRYLRRDMCDLQ